MMINLCDVLRANYIHMKNKWDPFHSKWKAALDKGMSVNLKGRENILYLGASSGTTVSFISNITQGRIFAVEKAPKMAIPLVRLSEERGNIFPIFADARDLEKISPMIAQEKIDVLFQDIPSIDQIKILRDASELVDKNCRIYLSLKTSSISQQPKQKTLQEVKKRLEKDFDILNVETLEPFHQKHYFLILKKK